MTRTVGRLRAALPVAVLVGGIVALSVPAAASAHPAVRAHSSVGAHSSVRALAEDECLGTPPGIEPGVPWAQQQLAPQRAWELTMGAGITVAVVDTGVDSKTPQLSGRVLRGTDVVKPGGGPADTDCYGHGTFIAGIIAAAPANGIGFVGIAPAATILPVRIANAADDGSPALLAKGIRQAVDSGAKVVNVSATTAARDQALVDAVAYAEQHDVLVVCAAANQQSSQTQPGSAGSPVYPAALPSVLAVGAVDAAGQLASFSQAGPYVGLAAPGVEVVSVGPGGPGQWQGSGTSYATAFVTGAAALVRAYRPGLTAAQVKHRLQATADHPAAALPDPGVGWGIVNPLAAVATVLPEEGTTGLHSGPPPVDPLAVPPHDRVGPVLVTLGAGGVVLLAFVVSLLAVLLPAGRRRGWRPARTAKVLPSPRPTSRPR